MAARRTAPSRRLRRPRRAVAQRAGRDRHARLRRGASLRHARPERGDPSHRSHNPGRAFRTSLQGGGRLAALDGNPDRLWRRGHGRGPVRRASHLLSVVDPVHGRRLGVPGPRHLAHRGTDSISDGGIQHGRGGLLAVPGALWQEWRGFGTQEALYLLGSGILVAFANYLYIDALRTGAIAVVAPFRYTTALWATIAGFIVWGDIPDYLGVIGTLFIIGSGLYTFYRELEVAKARNLQAIAS